MHGHRQTAGLEGSILSVTMKSMILDDNLKEVVILDINIDIDASVNLDSEG